MSWHAVKCTFCAICVFFLSLLLLTGSCRVMQSSALLVPFVLLLFLSLLLLTGSCRCFFCEFVFVDCFTVACVLFGVCVHVCVSGKIQLYPHVVPDGNR